jgi:hypothetical protein
MLKEKFVHTEFELYLSEAIHALEQQTCEDWHDIPSDEMTLEQARQAVKDLRKKWADHLEQEPFEDCISRQMVLDEISKVCFSRSREWIEFRINNGSNGERDYIIKFIKQMPSVQPEQKMGRWIYDKDKSSWYANIYRCSCYRCSCCGRTVVAPESQKNLYKDYPYCHCGAKMESGDEE